MQRGPNATRLTGRETSHKGRWLLLAPVATVAHERETSRRSLRDEPDCTHSIRAPARRIAMTISIRPDSQPTNPAMPGMAPFPEMVWIPGGTFHMGSDRHYPEERPVHRVTVDG